MCVSLCRCNDSRVPSRRGFTILELLIVIGIISVLAAILLPTVTQIKEQARAVQCQNNLKVIMQGILSFASDNEGRLVAPMNAGPDPNPAHADFMGGLNGPAPDNGTLFPYVGRNRSVYLCPTQQIFQGSGIMNDTSATGKAVVSNGSFDYSMFTVFDGARVSQIPPTSLMGNLTLPTPVIVQEAANTIDGGNQEAHHDNNDHMSHIHFGGSYYAAVDGAVYWVNEAGSGAKAWTCHGPSGRTVNMWTFPPPDPHWAWFDSQ